MLVKRSCAISSLEGVRHGTKIKCTITNIDIPKAIVVKWNNRFYICQNYVDGRHDILKYGFKFAWAVGNGTYNTLIEENVCNIQLLDSNTCSICGKKLDKFHLRFGLCKRCNINFSLVKCPVCGQFIRYSQSSSYRNLCKACNKKIPRCSICHKVLESKKFIRRLTDGTKVCYYCKRREFNLSQGFFNIFSRMKYEKKARNFIGFELELMCKRIKTAPLRKVTNKKLYYAPIMLNLFDNMGLKNRMFCASDSSIGDGIEFQSSPCTYSYLVKRFKLKKLFKYFSSYFRENKNCGLHFHLSREGISDNDITKMFLFFSSNKEKIKKLSNRRTFHYAQNVSMKPYCLKDIQGNNYPVSKYNWIFPQERTVEIRLFNATVSYDRFMVALQFVVLLRIFVKQYSKAFLMYRKSMEEFKKMAKSFGYNYLVRAL